jgi:mannose-6-phosphate isomerase-like protein (cupin superfamily)
MRSVVPPRATLGPRHAHFTRRRAEHDVTQFATTRRPHERTVVAPDGSDVRVLLGLARGGMAEFELGAGLVSGAITHRTVEEIWYVLAGRGQMWRRQDSREEVVALEPGVCLTIPRGTHFQFRALGDTALRVIGVTMPPWPGADEAIAVRGPWTVSPSGR